MRRALPLAAFFVAAPASAQAVFPAGAESKAAGLESSLNAQGAPAALYNPANLARAAARPEPYAEVGVASVAYSYEHPEFDPVRVDVTTPIATLGYSGAVEERVRWGVVVFPSKSGTQKIPGLPRKVGGSVTALEVEAEDRVVDLAAGIALKATTRLAVGFSAVRTFEDHVVRANLVGNANALTEMNYRNQFQSAVVGIDAQPVPRLPGLTAVLAYRPAKIKTYKGSQFSAGQRERTGSQVVGYDPETVSAGARLAVGPVAVGLEANKRWHARGGSVVKTGLAADKPDADLKDVLETAATASLALPRGARAGVGYARLPSPWGRGRDDGELANHVQGVDFGHLNGMDRQAYSLHGSAPLPLARGAALALTLHHARGEREVAGDGDNLGFYSLGVTALSGGLRMSF